MASQSPRKRGIQGPCPETHGSRKGGKPAKRKGEGGETCQTAPARRFQRSPAAAWPNLFAKMDDRLKMRSIDHYVLGKTLGIGSFGKVKRESPLIRDTRRPMRHQELGHCHAGRCGSALQPPLPTLPCGTPFPLFFHGGFACPKNASRIQHRLGTSARRRSLQISDAEGSGGGRCRASAGDWFGHGIFFGSGIRARPSAWGSGGGRGRGPVAVPLLN